MAVLKCKMCGGDLEVNDNKTTATCEYCGTTQTLPKIDNEQRTAAFNRGNHFRRTGEFDKALAVYEHIVMEDNTDAEAHWCCALCRFGIEYVEDPASLEYIPTCHRASFESFLNDVDYLAALEYSDGITRRQYQKDAAKIAEVQKGILATSQNEEPFDVFICYKESDEKGERTRDSLLAQDIYYRLTEQGKRVFFARITLEEKIGSQYEPYIFAALHSSKVMVVVGTKPEYFNAVWVKNEWSRFLALMKKDRNKLLLPCYRDMDPYDLPEQLSVLQSYDMSRIGFIQDLIHGINKVLGTDKKEAPQPQQVIQQVVQGGANAESLIKRAFVFLDDGDWDSADDYCEKVLDIDPDNGQAYLGKALVEFKAKSAADLANVIFSRYSNPQGLNRTAGNPDTAAVDRIAAEYEVPAYLDKASIKSIFEYDFSYKSFAEGWSFCKKQALNLLNGNRDFTRAEQRSKGDVKTSIQSCVATLTKRYDAKIAEAQEKENGTKTSLVSGYQTHLQNCEKAVREWHDEVLEKQENDYNSALSFYKKESYKEALEIFNGLSLSNYKDSKSMCVQCDKGIKRKQEEAAELERQKIAAEKARRLREQAVMAKSITFKKIGFGLLITLISIGLIWLIVSFGYDHGFGAVLYPEFSFGDLFSLDTSSILVGLCIIIGGIAGLVMGGFGGCIVGAIVGLIAGFLLNVIWSILSTFTIYIIPLVAIIWLIVLAKKSPKKWAWLFMLGFIIINVLAVAVAHDKANAYIENYHEPDYNEGEVITTENDGNTVTVSTSTEIINPDEKKLYYADIVVRDYGTITVQLDASAAPITVENFVNLAKSGFYDGLTFHRIMPGFIIQGGDPNGDGTGGSENTIKGEFPANGHSNTISHTRGVISMARDDDYNSASSQFFIMHADSTSLDRLYAAFGYVTSGMEVVDAICANANPTDDQGAISHDQQPVIETIRITEK